MSKVIRIGTRDSELALWQATTVQEKLENLGLNTQLMPVKSTGDLVIHKPLYALGITGIFTKTLDIALLKGDIDIAVHSMKDVPTQLPKGIVKAAVLQRAATDDVLVHMGEEFLNETGTIATGSLRRKAQWLHRYPTHKVVDLRGNVNSRLLKLIENGWNGAIFAKAGLERIKLLPKDTLTLDWMIPAPAQGAMLILGLEKDKKLLAELSVLNHQETDICTGIEREFLQTLEGGCTAPIGALAIIKEQKVYFKGCLHSLDGQEKLEVKKECSLKAFEYFGKHCAGEILDNGGRKLIESIKDGLNTIH